MSSLAISTFQPQISWPYGGSTATLRIKYSANFTDSSGLQVLRGLYKDVPCTVAASVLTVPQFSLLTTNDAQVNPLVTCSARFIDSNNSEQDWLFQGFSIPQSLTPTATIAALQIYNQGKSLVLPSASYLNRDQTTQLVLALLASIGVLADASAATKGITMLSIDPAILAAPIAWGQNDPAARDAQKLMSVELHPLMATPADTNVPVFDVISGTWKPGVGAQGAAGGDLSGTYPNPSVVNDSHLHSAATITSVPAHASTHENGGADEISVLGLSGLLADAQTPLAHKTSHENGGADEISVVGLSGLLADGQTPLAHKTSHQSGGSDAIKLDDLAAPDDNTDLNASITAHGLLPKLPNNAAQFLNGVGGFSTPAGAGDVVGPAASIEQEIALFDGASGKLLERATVTGLLKAAAGVLAAAVAGTDYVAPGGALGTPSSGTLTNCTADGTNLVGFRNIPQRSLSADSTTVLADAGGHLYHPTSDDNPRTYTIDSNANVPYPVGTAITFVNDQNTLTIAITDDTLVWAEDGSTGSVALAENGMATAIKVTSTRWIISGTGLS